MKFSGLEYAIGSKTASFTLSKADPGNIIRVNSATAVIATVQTNASASGIKIGAWLYINQIGAGAVTISAASGVSVLSYGSLNTTKGKDAVVQLLKVDTDTWIMEGDLAYDSDAQALFTAAGYSDPTQMAAINRLIVDYKGAGIWTKTTGLWGLCGGTASLHKWNYKDPRDLDAAHRIVFSGTITHASNGITGDGTSGYGDLKTTPSQTTVLGRGRLGIYNRTNNSSDKRDIGTEQCRLWIENGGQFRYQMFSGTASNLSEIADKRGWFISQRTGSTASEAKRNDVSLGTASTSEDTSSYMSDSLCICTNFFSGVPQGYSDRNYAGAVFGDNLTSTELTAEFNAWNTFNTSLSRNV